MERILTFQERYKLSRKYFTFITSKEKSELIKMFPYLFTFGPPIKQYLGVFLFNGASVATIIPTSVQALRANVTFKITVPYIVTFKVLSMANPAAFGISSISENLDNVFSSVFGGAGYADLYCLNVNPNGPSTGLSINQTLNNVLVQNALVTANVVPLQTYITIREYLPGILQWILTDSSGIQISGFPPNYTTQTNVWTNPATGNRCIATGSYATALPFLLVATPLNLI